MRKPLLTASALTAAALAALTALVAQDQGLIKFTADTNLVVVDLYARDKSGKIVTNLKKEDFTILEDGKPQKISIFELQKLESELLPAIAEHPRTVAGRRSPAPGI